MADGATVPVDPEEPRPWWDRALDVLRYEDAMFRVLLVILVAAIAIGAIVLGARAIF